ncbi:Uncharacterized protein BP5553_00502 [Venustampulla echinocandica]|uniref:Alpha-L-rhamnosidase C n=1 Tax=Venustampulla echinocandica TaxID=2656787 RepID=A0A370TYC7_9HELO|nr:Uncharacterized protein BP5553_00502 [Venustampulla echinocandica]RDL40523.1 Uncharacterized protein BP5553_00502 [Venustampulla echinocandica]
MASPPSPSSSTVPPSPGTQRTPTENNAVEPFPSLSSPSTPKIPTPQRPTIVTNTENNANRVRGQSSSSTIRGRLRTASSSFQESNPPTGMCIATAQIASSIPSLSDIRRGSYSSDGWTSEGQVREKGRRASLARAAESPSGITKRKSSSALNSPRTPVAPHDSLPEVADESEHQNLYPIPSDVPVGPSAVGDGAQEPTITNMASSTGRSKAANQRASSDTNISPNSTRTAPKVDTQYKTTPFDNGYQFPPKHSWTESTAIGLTAFWKFFITPIGFLVVVYGLNVVAWGGMLFLLLCNASPAMCHPTCDDINSPRRIWIEIDSQILNALFCVTGFGTIPWRFRDLYYLLQYRLQKKEIGLRRLAGINRGWFRLAGSQDLPVGLGAANIESEAGNVPESALPFPLSKTPDAPLTGIRAPPTKLWKLDFVIWSMVWNTFLQTVLCIFMWHFNRYERPSWSTGLFVALACIVAACGGIMGFIEGKHVKTIEGVPVSEKDKERLARDRELGITHYNNIKDEKPKEKKQKEGHGIFKSKQENDEKAQAEESAMEDATVK